MSSVAPEIEFNNGVRFPQIGLGTWQLDSEEMVESIRLAIDMGYRMIDTAACYNTERVVGQAVNAKIAEGVVRREDIFITSKLWITKHKPGLFIPELKASLENLGLDYLDLFLIHWPFAFKGEFVVEDRNGSEFDEEMTLEEKWAEMERCVEAGLTKSIGVSNFNSHQLQRILDVAKIKPVTNQVECHPYFNQKRLIEFCRERGVVVTAYAPFASPSWPDNPFSERIAHLLEDETLKQLAEKYHRTPAQVTLRYLIELGVVPIPKSSNLTRMRQNLDVFNFSLAPEDKACMDSLNRNLRSFSIKLAQGHRDYPFDAEF